MLVFQFLRTALAVTRRLISLRLIASSIRTGFFRQLTFPQTAGFDNYPPRGPRVGTDRFILAFKWVAAAMLPPKLQISKRLAVWTTAVVGALGSGAGAYSVVGNPWASDGTTAEVASLPSGQDSTSTAKQTQPVPILDEAAVPGQPQLAAPRGLETAASRRPPMMFDRAVAPASHTQSSAGAGEDRTGGAEPDAIRTTGPASEPTPAPAFDLATSPRASEPKLPEFQPPSTTAMQSAWAPNAAASDAPSACTERGRIARSAGARPRTADRRRTAKQTIV